MAAAWVLAPVLFYAHNRVADNPVMPWYLSFLVPGLAAAIGVGCESLVTVCRAGRWAAWATPLVGALVLLPLGSSLLAVLNRMAAVPRQPVRETAVVMRGTAPSYGVAGDAPLVTATFGTSAKRLRTYDPAVKVVQIPEELEFLERTCAERGQTLLVAYCGRNLAMAGHGDEADAELMRRIEAPGSGYRKAAHVLGWEELFSYHVWRRDPPPRERN